MKSANKKKKEKKIKEQWGEDRYGRTGAKKKQKEGGKRE